MGLYACILEMESLHFCEAILLPVFSHKIEGYNFYHS